MKRRWATFLSSKPSETVKSISSKNEVRHNPNITVDTTCDQHNELQKYQVDDRWPSCHVDRSSHSVNDLRHLAREVRGEAHVSLVHVTGLDHCQKKDKTDG